MKKHIRERLEFIKEKLDKDGSINRKDISDKFEVSEITAATDLKSFRNLNPDYIVYNYSKKVWERALH